LGLESFISYLKWFGFAALLVIGILIGSVYFILISQQATIEQYDKLYKECADLYAEGIGQYSECVGLYSECAIELKILREKKEE